MMRRNLERLLAELRRLKAEGVTTVTVSDESLQELRDKVASFAVETPAAAPPQSAFSRSETPVRSRGEKQPADASVPAAPAAPAKKTPKPAFPPPPTIDLPEGDKKTRWEALRKQVLECEVCNNHLRDGAKVVFGVGNLEADIFFVGEAPGAEEEVQGEPFVGPAGELLTRMIRAMGVERSEVYIGNIMNWRPEVGAAAGNRPPTEEEMHFCLPYLLAQIEIVQPKVLVALGATAVSGLFGIESKRRMRDLRGKWNDFSGTPTMVTYHPSYLLRRDTRAVKRTVWEDLLQVMERVGLPISDKQRNFFAERA